MIKKLLLLLLAFNVNAQDWVQYAIDDIIYNQDGNVSPFYSESDRKTLLKFGSNENVGSSVKSTIMTLNGSETNETYVSTNIINTVSSSSASDTEILTVEGHSVDGNGDFTFVVQNVTLLGQSKATLTTALARVSRVYNNNGTDLVGTIYVYEDTAISSGEPTDDTKIHIMIDVGFNQSEKASTTISSNQWWLINNVYADVLEKASSFCSIILEVREKGKVFRNIIELGATTGYRASHEYKPYLIIKPNSDIKLSAICSGTNINVSGDIEITVSPEFLDTVFRIVDSVSGYKASFGTSTFTANRGFELPNWDFDVSDYFDSIGNIEANIHKSTDNVSGYGYKLGWGPLYTIASLLKNGSGAPTLTLSSLGKIGFSNNPLNLNTLDTYIERTSAGVFGFNGTIDLSNAGTYADNAAAAAGGVAVGSVYILAATNALTIRV